MKFFRYVVFFGVLFLLENCQENKQNRWEIQLSQKENISSIDLAKEMYDPSVSLQSFEQKYPWFLGSVPQDTFKKNRTDKREIEIYQAAISKVNKKKLDQELGDLFSHIKFYFPKFSSPKVFLYSSALTGILDPIVYSPEKNYLFIDISGFLGDKSEYYKGLDLYFQKSMNPDNISPKVSLAISLTLFPSKDTSPNFLEQLVYNGKIQILQDAFLPKLPDELKIGYDKAQIQWAENNEANIWSYFVENRLLFEKDASLSQRFLDPGPFSKFYTEVDQSSSPQIGIWIGWQICRKYLQKNPKTTLQEFLVLPAIDIFQKSDYKPSL